MKRVTLWSFVGIAIIIGIAVAVAFQTGEKSPVYVAGKIRLADNLAGNAAGMNTLYLVLYDANTGRPMPYGAVRENVAENPQGEFFQFVITQEKLQVMSPNSRVPHHFRIKARLDRDGLGGVDQPGDLVGEIDSVAYGSANVEITIAKLVTE